MTAPAICPPREGDVRYPIDRRTHGHYIVVVSADDDWVKIRCHYPGDEPHERKLRLSTYLERYTHIDRNIRPEIYD